MEVKTYQSYYTLALSDKEVWRNIIKRSNAYDFHHTWYYHSLENGGEPLLFYFRFKDDFIALPLLKRKIEGTQYYDCTSVYGYGGPLSNVSFKDLDEKAVEEFTQVFEAFVQSEKIVSVFSRLHPLLDQDVLLNKLGGVHHNGKTVAIDLDMPYEVQVQNYRRAIRMKINQLRRKGFVLREATSTAELRKFVDVYTENMIKVNAAASYFFDQEYFENLLNAEEFQSKLLLAHYEGQVTAGMIVTCSDHIMQSHLAATSNQFLHDAPMKLLFDEATIVGRAMGMKYLHLGGGVGGKEDSLFNFKCGFSNLFFNFHTWRYIANEPVYNQLVEEKLKNQELENLIFPAYRSR